MQYDLCDNHDLKYFNLKTTNEAVMILLHMVLIRCLKSLFVNLIPRIGSDIIALKPIPTAKYMTE